MEGASASLVSSSAEQPPVHHDISIELELDRTIGYASIQNSVPVVRSLRLTNRCSDDLRSLEVLLGCNPAFARGTKLRFDKLAAGESRLITPIDLQPDHAYLADLQEAMNATVDVKVLQNSAELAHLFQRIEVLAYDQWAGTRSLPELLAAFSMPNNPAVDVLLGKASQLLRRSNPELSMNGYQSKSREVVWKQVSALYSVIAAENLQYAEPPASFGSDGQKIRTPDRILEGRVATCLDLAMLFSSCLEQAGLRPVVLMKQGHAWVGVWLHQASFAYPLTEDVQAVRKRVDTGEFLVFEATGLAQHHALRPSLRIALEQGAKHLLEEGEFLYAVDIHMARGVQIKPLPSRAALVRKGEVAQLDAPEQIEPTPQLPPLDPEYLAPIDLPTDETPDGRLAKWKGKLLDLTLRNRLLNFKPTKATLQLVAPDLSALEDSIAAGHEFRLKPLPGLMEGADPRSAQVHAGRTGQAPLDDMALQALASQELIARVPQEGLDGSLLALFSAARTGLEEGGANTLYLAIGMLKWREAEGAEATHVAPILLIPVSLTRQSVKSGFRLTRHDDETIVNPTLLQLLKSVFELSIPGLDAAAPTDEAGVDVKKILQLFRLAVREIAGWEVMDSAYLGIFSFTKYLMWKDLQDRTEQLKTNRVVKHLIEHPGEAFATEQPDERHVRLDEAYRPQDILAPLLSDSSQLKAICAVDSGRDLVLEGPPGTGKSQTITNLIAHSLAKGKSVLFVSEKMAALEVVHRRLAQIGLAAFCLELHSSKAKKSEVLQQLGAALSATAPRSAEEWAREAERLASLRQELNALVQALHRDHRNGLTVFDAIGTCIANTGREPAQFSWPDAQAHSREELDKLREVASRISALAQALPTLADHPLALIGQTEWKPSWQDELLGAAQEASAAAVGIREAIAPIAKLLHAPGAGHSLEFLSVLDVLADSLLAAPKVPAGLARQAHDTATRSRLSVMAKHGKERQAQWANVGPGWTPQLAKFNGTDLSAQWTQATSSWWLKAFFAKRGILARMASAREDTKPPSQEAFTRALNPLEAVNEEDQYLRGMQAEAETLLAESFEGPSTDWKAVELHTVWAKTFSDSVSRLAQAQSPGDMSLAESFRVKLQPLVGEQRALLTPGGMVGTSLLAYRDAYLRLSSALERLNALAHPVSPLTGPAGADGALERLKAAVERWNQSRREFQPWCLWRKVRELAISHGLQSLVACVEASDVSLADVESFFEFSYRSWWLKKTFDVEPVLREFASVDHERKIREFRAADAKFQKLTQEWVAATLAGRVPSATSAVVGAESEMGRLRRELQRQRGHMPVRKLVQGLPTLLPKLKPCLLMSPLSVAQYLDARHAQFDLVVFDEASQIPVWDAVGVIARGQQLVVVGDPKQLPPTNFFSKSTDEGDTAPSEEQVEDLESILDECLAAGLNRLSLKWHYRSKHESLITFSNVRYYGSELVTFPSPMTADVAVKFQQVSGVYDRGGSRTNRAEAEAIVKAIERHYTTTKAPRPSVGVVTFNQTQQALIETLLEARRRANSALDRALAEAATEPLFVKNLENVQGDERDLIFFSITYGPDAAGKVTMNFGPLNGEGGHRRLNVAVSRAREGVVIFSTLRPEQIDLSRVRAAGVRDLKHYLEFAIGGARALVAQSTPTGLGADSPFEAAVTAMLRDKGWDVHPQVGCSGYRIDMAVVDPRAPGRYLVGVECDGRSYHSGATARDRDRLRQYILEQLGWRIHRIWSTDWWLNPQRELEKLQAKLEALLQESTEPAAAAVPEQEAAAAPEDVVAEVEEAPAVPKDAKPLAQYSPVAVASGDPQRFYDPGAVMHLRESVQSIVTADGPVLDAVVFKRVARAWGLERTGSRIVERLRALMPSDVITTQEGSRTFLWPPGATPDSWLAFRVAGAEEHSKRHVDEVSLEEIAALVRHILQEAGSSTRQDIARTACRLLGMARTPADAENRVNEAITRLVTAQQLLEHAGTVRLS
jgi:very-short-patch-repair endonuclease